MFLLCVFDLFNITSDEPVAKKHISKSSKTSDKLGKDCTFLGFDLYLNFYIFRILQIYITPADPINELPDFLSPLRVFLSGVDKKKDSPVRRYIVAYNGYNNIITYEINTNDQSA